MRLMVSCTLALCLTLWTGLSLAQSPQKEKAAVAAAEQWLALIDAGHYAQSWKEAAEYFKNAVPEDKWEQTLKTVRYPLGKLRSREVKGALYRTSLPGAPDGEYVIVQFQTSLENKKSAIETVTPMLEKERGWRVSGYFIK